MIKSAPSLERSRFASTHTVGQLANSYRDTRAKRFGVGQEMHFKICFAMHLSKLVVPVCEQLHKIWIYFFYFGPKSLKIGRPAPTSITAEKDLTDSAEKEWFIRVRDITCNVGTA